MAKKANRKVGVKQRPKAKSSARTAASMHRAVFSQLVARAHEFEKPPLCYKQFPDGSAQVCRLLPDGTYGDCKRYDPRPVPGPRCG